MAELPFETKRRARSLEEFGKLQAASFNRDKIGASIAAYAARPSDVIITPYGKCGTTWTQQIFHTLRTRGDMAFDDISRVVPWIEMAGVLDMDINAEQRAEPRGFKSHLDYDHVPKGAKYINVIRHPVDAAYSAYKFMEGWFLEPGYVSADAFVAAGASEARYHKHFVSWWHHRKDDNVLYLVYEHMKADPERAVERIADFMGVELDTELRAIALENTSLPFMKAYGDRFDDAMLRQLSEATTVPAGSDSAKVRAGLVGAHTLSEATVDLLDKTWRTHVLPETGCESYEALIAAL